MWKRKTIRRAIIFSLLGAAIVLGFSYYNQRKSFTCNLERVAFALNLNSLPDSLQIDSAYVDSWTEYHILMACRDVTGRLDYILTGRDWKITETSTPWIYSSLKDKGLEYTIVREAKWDVEDDNISASVLFDQDGQSFVVEYHAY